MMFWKFSSNAYAGVSAFREFVKAPFDNGDLKSYVHKGGSPLPSQSSIHHFQPNFENISHKELPCVFPISPPPSFPLIYHSFEVVHPIVHICLAFFQEEGGGSIAWLSLLYEPIAAFISIFFKI